MKYLENYKVTRIIAWVLSLTFLGIVLIERVPGVMVPTTDPHESLMFGLFLISFLDDVTHGISGLMGLFALWHSRELLIKWLMLIGGYYTLDAGFHTIYSILIRDSIIHWFPINAPHYAISILCAIALYFGVREIKVNENKV